ncbi:MAG: YitT family protein [Gammaproteobacteria bacterium]|nr:YitT family protein [Gammaproteobacteria bacterium]MBU1414698.1 YitT family protein [Gammaproteobacteria bacterium]
MNAPTHSLLEDLQALLAGTLLISLGVKLIGDAQLVTGGIVGLALLLDHATSFGFATLFFLLNLPFYYLAFKQMGRAFVVKTLVAVSLTAAFAALMPRVLAIGSIDPFYAAAVGGLLMGVGLLILFRHQASLGGLNVFVLYLQARRGWRAGIVQLGIDAAILLAAIPVVSLKSVAISLISAATLNLSLAINHRHDRYIAA